MNVDLFDFDLPEALIALRPAQPRSAARLLEVGSDGGFGDYHLDRLPALLRPSDLLIFNDTKVIPAQLDAWRLRGGATARVEITLHLRRGPGLWRGFAKGAKKLKPGDLLHFGDPDAPPLSGKITACLNQGEVEIDFDCTDAAFDEALAKIGKIPLPPYISARRAVDAQDTRDYQTIYARHKGAVAAPTAGLHFDTSMLEALSARGVAHAFVTLHVGAGTFLPVKAADTADHQMHSEFGRLDTATAGAINAAKSAGRRVVAVGTTSLRIVESSAVNEGQVAPFEGTTDIFIEPGYRFKVIDGLITNFHLPRSTLFMLVSALAGRERMLDAYTHAVSQHYRFYSYGDASLLWKA